MTCRRDMSRLDAERHVKEAYGRALGRNPFPDSYDAGAYDWVMELMYHGMTWRELEVRLRNEPEAYRRAEDLTRAIYFSLLGRDPGPVVEGGPWRDTAALDYAHDIRLGRKSEEDVRREIMASEEYRERQARRVTRAEVLDNVLLDAGTGRRELELGISLFYACSPDVSDAEFLAVVKELAAAEVRQVRLAGSTYTWDNPLRKANVIPFAKGKVYVHEGGVDDGVGVDPSVMDAVHKELLGERLGVLTAHGIRAQYTILWGGTRALFTADNGSRVLWERLRGYLQQVAVFFSAFPEHTLEIINEADHGHHLARLGEDGRKAFLSRAAKEIRGMHPRAVITASDGGRQPENEGDPYFAYHHVPELDYWNVHFPRDTVLSEGIPRWSRGSWHLYGDRGAFRQAHGKGGYGRSDENIFLQTREEAERWGYRGATLDWRMYGTMLWVTTAAGVGLTLHTHKGFFCEPGLTRDDVFQVVAGWNQVLEGFPWQGATSFNTGWNESPVTSYQGPFKAFALVSGENGRDVLVVVLNPAEGRLSLNMDRPREARVYEITGGKPLAVTQLPPGNVLLNLPKTAYEHALVIRLHG